MKTLIYLLIISTSYAITSSNNRQIFLVDKNEVEQKLEVEMIGLNGRYTASENLLDCFQHSLDQREMVGIMIHHDSNSIIKCKIH